LPADGAAEGERRLFLAASAVLGRAGKEELLTREGREERGRERRKTGGEEEI